MIEAKLLRKKLKNGLIVDKWDLVTIIEKQQDRIAVLEANHKIQLDINKKALQYIEQLEQGLQASIKLNRAQNERT